MEMSWMKEYSQGAHGLSRIIFFCVQRTVRFKFFVSIRSIVTYQWGSIGLLDQPSIFNMDGAKGCCPSRAKNPRFILGIL